MIQRINILILMVIGVWESTAITNKRPSNEQSANVRFFRHISNGPSSGPLADWEVGLREAIHQAFLREGYWEPNLRERLNIAQLIGRQDVATPFGDVAVLGRGQVYAVHGGNFILLQDPYQNDCDDCHNPRRCERHNCQPYTPHNQEILLALWTVKRLRHREVDRTRFELEYIISPVNANNDQIIMRRNRFNYAIPGHVFVIKSSETNKYYPEYYNKKIIPTHFKPEVILGVDSDGHKHILYSYPGFITSVPSLTTTIPHTDLSGSTIMSPGSSQLPFNDTTTPIPGLSATQSNASTTKEAELYKKLLETLASKSNTTKKLDNGPHRFSLQLFADAAKTMINTQSVHSSTDQLITSPLIPISSIKPEIENNLSPMTPSTKATVHYFMPTGEEILMTQTEIPTTTTTEKATPKTTLTTTRKPTKKYYNIKTTSKPKTTKYTTVREPTSGTTPIEITELLKTPLATTSTISTMPQTTKSSTILTTRYSTTIKPSTQKILSISSTTKSKRPRPFSKTTSLSTTSPRPFSKTTSLSTTSTTTEGVTNLKIVATTTPISSEEFKQQITTTRLQQFSPKIPNNTETLSQSYTLPMKTEVTTASSSKVTSILTTIISAKPTTLELHTTTKPPEVQSIESSKLSPTEPMKTATKEPISTIQTSALISNLQTTEPTSIQEIQETTSMSEETISTKVPKTSSASTTGIPTSLLTTTPQTTTLSTRKPTTTTHRTTTVSDFLTEAEPYRGPLYVGTVKNDYDLDDIFGTTKSTEKPSTTTREAHTDSDISKQLFDDGDPRNAKVIFSNFYEASTSSNADSSVSDGPKMDNLYLTSQSYETSVSYEVNKRNQPEYLPELTTLPGITRPKPKVKGVEYKRNHSKLSHYRAKKITTDSPTKANVKQMPAKGSDYVIYKAEYPNENNDVNETQNIQEEDVNQTKSTKEAFDDVALMLVNHAKSLEYLSKADNKTVRVKYRRRKTYVPRSRTTKKPVRRKKEQETEQKSTL